MRHHGGEELLEDLWTLSAAGGLGQVLQRLRGKGRGDRVGYVPLQERRRDATRQTRRAVLTHTHLVHDGVEVLLAGAVLALPAVLPLLLQVCQEFEHLRKHRDMRQTPDKSFNTKQ